MRCFKRKIFQEIKIKGQKVVFEYIHNEIEEFPCLQYLFSQQRVLIQRRKAVNQAKRGIISSIVYVESESLSKT